MNKELGEALKNICSELFEVEAEPELTRPEEQFGDFSTNVAMRLAGKLKKNPRDIADLIVNELKATDKFAEVKVAGPGFINIKVKDQELFAQVTKATRLNQEYKDQVIVCEYSDPNPFKILHIGHVYSTIVGDAIANLFEAAGAKVHRVNYGGDVGMHVAKTLWAIVENLGGQNYENLLQVPEHYRASWLSERYVQGNKAFENNLEAKAEITDLNKKIYKIHEFEDHISSLAQIYWECRKWSYEAFDKFYARLGTKMEKYYPESEIAFLGHQLVSEQIGKVFEKSDGAIVFRGEKHKLHTRVFINNENLPTYEAKEIGLFVKKKEDYNFDLSIIITAKEQEQYMAVVVKALQQFLPKIARVAKHVSHGMVRLGGNVKMSSRLGNIIPADKIIDLTKDAAEKITGKQDNSVILGAIKYSLLKSSIGNDIIYDPKESVSLEGNSGPYLQYSLVRAKSILVKAVPADLSKSVSGKIELNKWERSLARKISEYPEIFEAALESSSPHHICNYLFDLAQVFNRFYENNRVVGDERSGLRLYLLECYINVLENGLGILGIPHPEKM